MEVWILLRFSVDFYSPSQWATASIWLWPGLRLLPLTGLSWPSAHACESPKPAGTFAVDRQGLSPLQCVSLRLLLNFVAVLPTTTNTSSLSACDSACGLLELCGLRMSPLANPLLLHFFLALALTHAVNHYLFCPGFIIAI